MLKKMLLSISLAAMTLTLSSCGTSNYGDELPPVTETNLAAYLTYARFNDAMSEVEQSILNREGISIEHRSSMTSFPTTFITTCLGQNATDIDLGNNHLVV